MAISAHHRSARVAGQCSLLRDGLTDSEMADLSAVLDSAEALLGPGSLPPLENIHDFQQASTALESGWTVVRRALAEGGKLAGDVAEATSLDDLLHRMQRTERVMRSAEVRGRDRAVKVAMETLAGLQDMTNVSQLVDAGAEAVCRLGFDRAIVSSVKESTWLTEAIYVDGDSEWAADILAAGREAPEQIQAGLPEQDLVRRRKPIVVTRVQQKATVHAAVAQASQSKSYVAAPIMPRSRVIGFLHGDRFFHRGDVTQFDSDLLGLFAQGYGFALERAILMQELSELRMRVSSLTRGIDSALSQELGGFEFGRAAQSSFDRAPVMFGVSDSGPVLRMQSAAEGENGLTRRELEVLKLMASGDTNQRIANKLIISEGTVKSHVKHILRKLGAANRAEAVSRWHSGVGPA